MSRLASALFLGLSATAFCSLSVCVAFVDRQAAHLPSLAPLLDYRPFQSSDVLDAGGRNLGQFSIERRKVVPLDAVPKLVQDAFISAEDQNFWRHQGVDAGAILHAALDDLSRSPGQRMRGASTITEQVIKNLVVGDERSIGRKVRESLLAVQAERDLGKKRILELYLNEIYLGHGAYGVAAAAQTYFNKPLTSLDAAEAATLAALPKSPRNDDPIRHPRAAMLRRSYVLRRMHTDGVVDDATYAAAEREALPTEVTDVQRNEDEAYPLEAVRREAVSLLGQERVMGGGLTIRTGIVPEMQSLATAALRHGLVAYDERHGYRGPVASISVSSWQDALATVPAPDGLPEDWSMAVILGRSAAGYSVGTDDGDQGTLSPKGMAWAGRAATRLAAGDVILVESTPSGLMLRQMPQVEGAAVLVDPRTGKVEAEVGGFSFERSPFDRAIQSERQPGSTVKPFIYLTALEHGYHPDDPVLDVPVALDQGAGMALWRPGADGGDGWGMISMTKALMFSRNLAAVREANEVGLDALSGVCSAFGLYDRVTDYADALGAKEVTLLSMTTAYAEFANGGYRLQPALITEIDGANGAPVLRAAANPMNDSNRIAPADAVAALDGMLRAVVTGGTGEPAFKDVSAAVSGKTGTSNDEKDAWFVGFTPTLAVGVHVGYDEPRSLGENEMGAEAAAPIAAAIFQSVATTRDTVASPAPAAPMPSEEPVSAGELQRPLEP